MLGSNVFINVLRISFPLGTTKGPLNMITGGFEERFKQMFADFILEPKRKQRGAGDRERPLAEGFGQVRSGQAVGSW